MLEVVVDALVYVCKLLPLSVDMYRDMRAAARAWLRSRRAVGDFSLRRAFATASGKSEARGWDFRAGSAKR